MPTDERIQLHVQQCIPPLEHMAQRRHQPAGGIVSTTWFDLALLEERELFAEKEILSSQGVVGTDGKSNEPD